MGSFLSKSEVPKNQDAFRVGILGAASIAPNAIIFPAKKIPNVVISAVSARDKAKAQKYAKKYKIPVVFDTYEELINSPDIDIIYNPLPNGSHAYYTILALKAGKHVLCEKPLASNVEEVDQINEALKVAPLNPKTNSTPVVVEAVHNRFHPMLLKLQDKIENGEYGEVKKVSSTFYIPWFIVPKSDIRYNVNGKYPALAGGSIMDLGCYSISFTRLVAESYLNSVANETEAATFKINKAELTTPFPGVDSKATVAMTFGEEDKSVQAHFFCSMLGWLAKGSAEIETSTKKITVFNFLMPHIYHYVKEKDLVTGKTTYWKEYGDGTTTYGYQLLHFLGYISGTQESAELCNKVASVANARRTMTIIDAVYVAAGEQPRKGMPVE